MERQPSESKLKLIADVERLARARFPEGKAEATGLFVLLAHLVESLMDDQVVSSVLAAIAMVVLMQLAFRNVWLSLILLVPNVFPIVVVIGTMGWLDMKLNVGTAMIAAVSMGLTIDSSIIYIAEYQAARQRGLNFAEALMETHQGVGLALVFSNVALVVGFTVLMLSNFVPLIYFGLLVSVAMVGGLIGNLILLPLLLRLIDRAPPPLIPTPSGDSPLLPPLPGGGQGGAEGNPP
jgi:predicted RND superfamily exporter protein